MCHSCDMLKCVQFVICQKIDWKLCEIWKEEAKYCHKSSAKHKNIVPEQKAHAVSVHAKIAFFAHSLTRLINTRIGRDSKLQTR